MGGASNGEAGKQQKRSAIQSFLAPCSNASAKKQRVAHSGDLEALKVVVCVYVGGGGASKIHPFLRFSMKSDT